MRIAARHAAVALALLSAPLAVSAQETGHGDLFGDLVHILRDAETGQPILQKRMIEYPEDIQDWGYCPIPIDVYGQEIPFVELSCDVDPTQLSRLVEVDYFGRLSGGRTRERNIRMHFDEVIVNIKEAERLDLDPAGRLFMGTDCTPDGCASWKTVDSPQENMALYYRLMRYGHLQTDPLEEDTSYHGDPETGTVYHPALAAEDWDKFQGPLAALLPQANASQCFSGDTFVASCAAPTALTAADFVRASSFLGGAADKHGKITADLVQYMNRILKLTVATAESAATLNTLPALIRDETGLITPAIPGMPAPADELFVDFSPASYLRTDHFTKTYAGLRSAGEGTWVEDPALSILDFLVFINGPTELEANMGAFIASSSDALRAVEFIHNYEAPEDMWSRSGAVATSVSLAPDLASPQPPNTTITFTATPTGGVAPHQYQWWIFANGAWSLARAWDPSPTFAWAPAAEGSYRVGVWVRSAGSTSPSAEAVASVPFDIIQPRVASVTIASDLEAPQILGATVTFTATAAGGLAPQEFKWWVFDGVAWTEMTGWSDTPEFVWTPSAANASYRVGVWARSAGSSSASAEAVASVPFAITPVSVTLTADLDPPQVPGTLVTVTATPSGPGAYEYRWWLFNGVSWALLEEWSVDPVYEWMPVTPNPAYRVGVWIRVAGSGSTKAAATAALPFAIVVPLTTTSGR